MMVGAGTANRILARESSFFVIQPEGVAPKEGVASMSLCYCWNGISCLGFTAA